MQVITSLNACEGCPAPRYGHFRMLLSGIQNRGHFRSFPTPRHPRFFLSGHGTLQGESIPEGDCCRRRIQQFDVQVRSHFQIGITFIFLSMTVSSSHVTIVLVGSAISFIALFKPRSSRSKVFWSDISQHI